MFEVLVIYRWASLGGVERMLLNRAHAFKEYGRRVRFNVLFLEDVGGGKQALREYVRCHELEHQFRLVENIHEISPDLTLAIDTPEAFSMIPADWPLILECHTAYEKNRQYLSHLSSAPHNILALWVPTTTFARRLALEFPDLGRLIDVVPNSLAAPGADLPQEAHRYPGIPVLYLGRVDTLKNVVDVVRIVARARTLSGQDFRLLIIGDVYDDRLLPTITEEAMDYFVATLPSVEFHQTTFILQQVRRQQGVFVSASRGETFGLAAAEAMAHRLPVLLSDIPEHRTLVRDNEHLLFEQGDQQAAAEKLCWLAGDNWPAASAWVHVCAGGITSEAFIDAWDRAMKTVGFEVGFPVAPKRPVTQSAMLDLWPLLTRQIQEMHTTRQERDALAQQRDEVASQRDGYATALEQTLAQMEISHRLNADITASYSWRVTAPIRFVLRFIRHGFLAEDRRWFEAVLRRVFHHLPLSFAQKEKLFHWYGRHFGYPLAAPGQDTQAKVRNAAEPPPLPGGPSQTSNAGNEFIAPDHWDHRHTPYGVLCLPIIDWNFRFQRPQQLARRFAVTGHPVSYASLRFGPDLAVTDLETGVRGLTLPGSESTNVYQEMPTEADVTRLAESLRRYMTAHPGHPWVCVVQLPYWGPVAERLRQQTGCYVVYDCMDDHSGFSTNGEAMLAAENHLLRSADLVVASSQTLFDKVAPLARQALMIRNAVDYPHFAAVPETHRASSASLTVGYYGAIADWFDSDLMAALAKSRPNWRLVLIGSTFSADIGPLEACQNIVLTGEKPYAELPLLIADWDCCVIPFKRLPLTEATNPVKVYEMLAAGKPVVAVSLPELRPIAAAGHIALADTSTAFAREIEQAVAENDSERQTARRRYAAENTWAIRQETLDKAIRELYPLVSIVIVTYNSLAFNRLCLESVFNDTDYPNYEIIVVDNASTDGTPEYLKGLQHPRLRVLLNEENRGFSAANNQGLALANGEYFCLLNNDTIVSGSWLSTLVGHLRAHPGLGLVGPVTNAIGNEARIPVGYCNLLDMPAWASAYCQAHRDRLEDISMLAFFCVAMPRAVFETVGPLDERFGIGMFEDDDYNRRVREAGFQIKLAQDAYIHHWQCASFKILGEDAYFATYYENEKKYRAKWAMNALDGAGAQKLAGLVEASKSAPGTLIFAPSIGWDIHLFQRPHHLAKVMAQDGYTVIFDCSNSLDDVALLQEVEPRLFLFKGEPELLWGLHNPVLWTFPYNYDYRDRFPSDIAVIYDWIDDLSVFPHDQEMLAKLHARAMKEATLVACVARRLHDMALAERPDVLYLPNAVEEGRFDHPPTPNPALSDKAFARIVASGKPIAGYYGALARWFDYELLAQVAELRPDWHFVLIGPDHDGTIGLSSMAGHDNITWLGPRDYQALPGYLHRFDVAMIPFKINDITLATSPLKLFEYFAGGRPVVTTPMPECMAFSEVRIGSDANTFSAALDQARNDGKSPDFQAHLLALSYENTWRARARAALVGLASRNAEGATNERRVMAKFARLEQEDNRYYFRALARHLACLVDDPCLPMYFQFALSANERGRSAVRQLAAHIEIQGKRHLDVGCAYGGFLVAFTEKGADSCGFDIDSSLLDLAKQNFKDVQREPVTYLKDVTRFQDIVGFENRFDIVTCNDVIEHVSDPALAFKHISTMLVDGGMAYFDIPNRDAAPFVLQDGHYQLFGITQLDHDEAKAYYAAHAPGNAYTVGHYLRLPEYRRLMDAAGLEMEILDETLAGVGMQPTLDQLHQVEQALSNNLPSVPEPVRGRVADVVGDYTRRAKTARRKTLEEQTDFLLTYGASFWKILARKKTGLDQIKSDRPIPALFSGWKHIAGQCNICGQQTRFFYRDPALYRESLTCEHCRSTSRYRSIARGLLDAIKAVAGVEAPSLSQLPRTGVNPPIRLYDTQPPFHYEPCAYPIPEYLGLCDWIELHLSSYKPDLPLGTMLSQTIANQNLERLTYPDAYFDIVITSDVMEHVRLDDKAHGEIARVLKPGGIYLFTVPHNWEWERNLIRVRVDDPGRLENDVHVLPPEYHGDANGDGTGILAFRAYGRELAEQLAAGGLTLNYEKTDLPGQGILNTELFYCEKSAKPESCAAGNPMHGRMAAALPAIQPGARPRIIIHAGAPKTGTTLIQVYLLNYFRHDDYFYLNPDIINNSGFLDRVHGLHDRTVDVLELAKSAGWKAGQTLVISHEALLGYGELLSIAHQHYFYGAIHDNARRLKTLLTDCDIEVVYYVRRQDEFIVSFYLEHIAYCYRDTKINFDDFISVQEPEKMSWLSRLNELVDVFGEEHVRFGLFDEIKAGPSAYVANFMRRIGVDVAEKDIPDLGRERPSLSAEAYELAMTAQKLTLDDAAEDKLFELLRTHFSNRTHHKADLLSTERRAWLMSLCEADNVAMFEKYFPDQPPRLWHVSKTMRVAHVLEN